jgi:hypothetical protein
MTNCPPDANSTVAGLFSLKRCPVLRSPAYFCLLLILAFFYLYVAGGNAAQSNRTLLQKGAALDLLFHVYLHSVKDAAARIASLPVAGPWLSPMHRSPRAETSRPLFPNLRFRIAPPRNRFSIPRVGLGTGWAVS